MTARANSRKASTEPSTSVVRRAREIADTGDRLFLSVAGGLGRIGGWARREADIAADSAAAAFTTTVHVARKLTGLEAPRPRPRAARKPSPAKRASARRRDGTLDPSAVPTLAWSMPDDPAKLRNEQSGAAIHPAGVVPLLQALGRTVADHTQRGYATLEQDERFWTLIHLLQLLSRPVVPPRRAATESEKERKP
jgi:hypothetical protein